MNIPLVRRVLKELASEEEQRPLWFSDESAERDVSSFVEAVCQLFDDSGLGIEMKRKQAVFCEPVNTLFAGLETLLQSIDSDRAPSQIIADPRMAEVRALAADLLGRLPL